MPDREKVIKELKDYRDIDFIKEGITVFDNDPRYRKMLINNVIALLKEQEAVEPKTEPSVKGYWYTCGVCGWWLFEVRDTVHFDDRKRIHFCASCGRAVKWE